MKHLLLTVGGSCEPLVKAIKAFQPDTVHFICSADSPGGAKGSYTQVTGKGLVCGSPGPDKPPTLPNLPTQTGLRPEQVRLSQHVQSDSFDECYRVCADLIESILKSEPDALVTADYTGGTKSMTAGLVAAAVDSGRVELQVVTGVRRDLTRVKSGTEVVVAAGTAGLRQRRALRLAESLLARWDYRAAAEVLEECARQPGGADPTPVIAARTMCLAFDAWDRFEYDKALELLRAVPSGFRDHLTYLGAVRRRGESGRPEAPAGYLLAQDLLANAGRRAAQGRYDDAVARLYRAVEQLAQARLEYAHGILTSAAPRGQLPDEWTKGEEGDTVALGLCRSWELITLKESGAPLAALYEQWSERLLTSLSARNYSMLAHGTQPIGEPGWREVRDNGMGKFVEEVLQALRGPVRLSLPPDWPAALPAAAQAA